jgi:hypothetical protein
MRHQIGADSRTLGIAQDTHRTCHTRGNDYSQSLDTLEIEVVKGNHQYNVM